MGAGRDKRRKRKRVELAARIRELECRDDLRRQELADTDATIAEMREREAGTRGDPRPWWDRATEAEGGFPL